LAEDANRLFIVLVILLGMADTGIADTRILPSLSLEFTIRGNAVVVGRAQCPRRRRWVRWRGGV
jgi:hypothetical protein